MDREPATIASAFTALLEAIFGLGAAFGLGLSPTQQHAIIGAVMPLAAVTLILGQVIRGHVWSPATHLDAVNNAFQHGFNQGAAAAAQAAPPPPPVVVTPEVKVGP